MFLTKTALVVLIHAYLYLIAGGQKLRQACDDKASWCPSIYPGQCYDSQTASTCCSTCRRYKRNKSSCEYGDKDTWCSGYVKGMTECSRPEVASSCCQSCASYLSCYDKASWCPSIYPGQCYDSQTASTCCSNCRRYKKNKSSCEYGDKDSWCSGYVKGLTECSRPDVASSCCQSCASYLSCNDNAPWCPSIYPGQCYDSQTASTCCSNCRRYKRNKSSCEYGDRAPWCSSVVGPRVCSRQDVVDNCCQSCAPYKENRLVCYDNAWWCPSLFPGQCYDSQTVSTCCSTCSRHKRSNSNCLYGNRYTWCQAQYCRTNRYDCCDSCP